MIVATWNVNSLRTRLPRVLAFLERHRPDLLCLQETKVVDDSFPREALRAAGYRSASFGQRTYNGVAILSRADGPPLEDVSPGFPGDPIPEQARVLSASFADLRVIDAYVVNGKAVGDEKYLLKLRWLDAFTDWVGNGHPSERALLIVGDFNIAPEDGDVWDPERWRGRVLCSDAERERLRRLLEHGYTDLHRAAGCGDGAYTWWDYRMGAFHRGWGLRIDLALGNAPVAARLRAAEVDREERKASSGEGKPSDHAPLLITLD